MKMSNKIYDVLKWVAIIVLPALATFVKVVFAAWNLPYADPNRFSCAEDQRVLPPTP